MGNENFVTELQHLINKHSQENLSDTPDFILAKYVQMCLEAFAATVRSRDTWYGGTHATKAELPVDKDYLKA